MVQKLKLIQLIGVLICCLGGIAFGVAFGTRTGPILILIGVPIYAVARILIWLQPQERVI